MVIVEPWSAVCPAFGLCWITVPLGSVVFEDSTTSGWNPASRIAFSASACCMPTTSGTCSGPRAYVTVTVVPRGTLWPPAGSVERTCPGGSSDLACLSTTLRWALCSAVWAAAWAGGAGGGARLFRGGPNQFGAGGRLGGCAKHPRQQEEARRGQQQGD